MAPPPTLVLAPITDRDDLKTCTPYLMPFHVDYSGPAPISTYLRVNATNETVGAPPPPENGANEDSSTLHANEACSSTFPKEPIAANTLDSMDTDAPPTSVVPPPRTTLAKRVTNATTRFISSFRGRTIQGLKVPLPEGYVGVVLHGEGTADGESRGMKGAGKAKAKAKVNTNMKTRATRSRMRADEDKQEPMDVDHHEMSNGGSQVLVDEEAVRTLTVSSQFSSFVLWYADRPVDENGDDYARALTEWTRLAHVIHRVENWKFPSYTIAPCFDTLLLSYTLIPKPFAHG